MKLAERISKRKYEIMMISFLILIFGDTFSDMICLAVLLPLQNMLTALVVFYSDKKFRLFIGTLIILLIILVSINCFDFTQLGTGLILVLYATYFVLISVKVYQKIFASRIVSSELLSALLCGFILLCLSGAILFSTVEVNYPHSFLNIGLGPNRFKNLTYFSFTTLLTIGYGDIVPLTLIGKRAVMLMSLTGHIYTVFLTGIIIGKYIREEKLN